MPSPQEALANMGVKALEVDSDVYERTFGSRGSHSATAELDPLAAEVTDMTGLEPVESGNGVLSSISNIARPVGFSGLALATGVVGLQMTEAVAFANSSHAGPAKAADVKAHAASTQNLWQNLGGDPVVKGGIHSKSQYRQFITSAHGRSILHREGLDTQEVAAVVKKARQRNGIQSCNLRYGETVRAMAFHGGDKIERNVKFTDSRFKNSPAPAFCIKATLKQHFGARETISTMAPEGCVNVSLLSKKFKHIKGQSKAPVMASKFALTEKGDLFPETPTGTFHVRVKCWQNGKLLSRVVDLNYPDQVLAACDLKRKTKGGKTMRAKVTVDELATTGPDTWIPKTPVHQVQKMRARGNLFVFKDQEAGVTPPPTTTTPPKTCEEQGGTPVQCHPKTDGPRGAGAGTPGNTSTGSTVGGPGAGGSPGNQHNAVPCYDPNTMADGDLNPNTEGQIMYVADTDHRDINQDCVGPAEAAVNG